MSFSPDAVKHLLESVPAEAVCQLVDDVNVAEIREELGLGALTGGALANVMKAAQTEGERILDAAEAGIAGPGIGYVRAHAGTVAALARLGTKVPGVDGRRRRTTSSCAGNSGSTRSPPTGRPRSCPSSCRTASPSGNRPARPPESFLLKPSRAGTEPRCGSRANYGGRGRCG